MHDDQEIPGTGDSSSGIHRIVDPPQCESEWQTLLSAPDPGPDGVEFNGAVHEPQVAAASSHDVPDLLDPTAAVRAPEGVPILVDPSAETLADGMFQLPLAEILPEESSPAQSRRAAEPQHRPLLLIALASYASAATLALLYLYFAMSGARPHALESLPDVPPLDVQHGEVMKLAPADAELPAGHRLVLGEPRRFGNLLIEPLRVERGAIEFDHFSGRTAVRKPATSPVLMLWLRFTNVSEQQTIAPLDPELVFRRTMLDVGPRANQFVRRVADEAIDGPQVLLYDHPISSEWDLRDQQLGVRLAPGESLETYLPSGEAGIDLSGPLVWRVHFRKGYSPQGFGVTTLVDVEFDAPPPASSPAA